MSNSDNPFIGAQFQKEVQKWFINEYNKSFELEAPVRIGSPLSDPDDYKEHKFDIVSTDHSIAVECKCYTWTKSGNVPSAKMGFTNEAAFYLSLLPRTYKKYIVMRTSYNSKRKEYLADYYYRTNKHLLGDITVAEFDPLTNKMRFIG